MKARARLVFVLVLLALAVAGCAGAGPAAGTAGGRARCTSGGADEQRPLFFIFCVESP